MNKFKKTIDKIELDETEKRKILNNILNHKKKSFSFNTFVLKFATFVLASTLVIGSSYALVKYFKLDNKIKDLFDLNDKVANDIEGSDINISKKYEDLTINILQTITSENNLYIRLDLIGKNGKKYISNKLLNENFINEDDIERTEYDDGMIEYFFNNQSYESVGMTLLDEKENITSYLLEFSFVKSFNGGIYALRIYTENDKAYDITFNIEKNNSKTIKKEISKTIYNKNNLKLKTNYISINYNNVTLNYNVNDENIFSNLEAYGEQFESCKLKYKDNKIENLVLIINKSQNNDGSYNSIFGYKNNFIDLDNVKSIIINNTEFEL